MTFGLIFLQPIESKNEFVAEKNQHSALRKFKHKVHDGGIADGVI